MDALKCLCPACNLIFEVHPAQTVVTCPVCDTPVGAQPPTAAAPAAVAPAPVAAGGHSRRGLAALAVLAFLGAGVGLAVYGFNTLPHTGPAQHTAHPGPAEDVRGGMDLAGALPPEDHAPQLPPTPAPPPQPVRAPEPPRIARAPEAAPPSLRMRVNRAIDRGVVYLRRHMANHALPCRYEGLLGLTLLECGVKPSDPIVQRIAASLRSQAPTLNRTYELATSIFFFDRLGRPTDISLIRNFADRLLAGQTESGTWSYTCPILNVAPVQSLAEPWKITDRRLLPRPRRGDFNPLRPAPLGFPGQPGIGGPGGLPGRPGLPGKAGRRSTQRGDHSNTQFALTALWIAQRYGAPVHVALRATGRHFRETQDTNGSWGYPILGHWTFSNTCAGLLGLAVEHGIDHGIGRSARPNTLPNDRVAHAALRFLGRAMPAYVPGGGVRNFAPLDGRDIFYTLWSMERVGTVYGLHRIGSTEWYPWAAELLVDTQEAEGCWTRHAAAPISTCFALLVLRRSNLVPDLTEAITGRDPRRRSNPPLMTERPRPSWPPENGAVQRPGGSLPPTGATIRPHVPMPPDGIAPRPGPHEPLPDPRGIAPRQEAIAKPRAN